MKKEKELTEKKDNGNKDKENIKVNEKKKDEEKNNIWGAVISTIGEGIKAYFEYKTEKNKTERAEYISKSKDSSNAELTKKLNELMKKEEDRINEQKEQKQHIADGKLCWNDKKNKIIELILNEINYHNLIKKIFENYWKDFKEDILKEIVKLLNDDLKKNQIVLEKYNSILKRITIDITQMQTLNFIIVGKSGAGKSTLINALLKKYQAAEGDGINSVTQDFKRYESDKVPGLTLYDTIGVEESNPERNLLGIKKMVQDIFVQKIEKPETSLHGILYCISNGNSEKRVGKPEMDFIKNLNKLNGDCDILTIVLTQTIQKKSEERKKMIQKDLNNENIDIIKVMAKDLILEDFDLTIKAFGLDNLIASIKKNAKKIVKANLNYITKNKIKKEYLENTNQKYDDMKKKLKNQEFEITFTEECEAILENLIGNINLNFENLEKVVTDSMEILNEDVKKKFIEENKSNGFNQLYEEFRNLNDSYEGQIKDSLMKESFMIKLNNYYNSKIKEEVSKILFEKASLLFMEKSRDFFSELFSALVKDKDIEDIANSALDKILEQINKID